MTLEMPVVIAGLAEFGVSFDWTLLPLSLGLLSVLWQARNPHPPTVDEPPKASRALSKDSEISEAAAKRRKNHIDRLKTAVFYVPFVPSMILFQLGLFKIFLLMMIWLGIGEFLDIVAPYTIFPADQKQRPVYVRQSGDLLLQLVSVAHGAVCFFGSVHFSQLSMYACFYVMASFHMIDVLRGKRKADQRTLHALGMHILGFLWISITLSQNILFVSHPYEYRRGTMTMLLLTSWIADVGGYYVGRTFGSHHVVPRISPQKTIEGTVAGLCVSLLLCAIFKSLQLSGFHTLNLPPVGWGLYMLFGGLVGVADLMGDIFGSFVKRAGLIKDSGTLFVGHGGVLDRFDSFFFVAHIGVLCSMYGPIFLV